MAEASARAWSRFALAYASGEFAAGRFLNEKSMNYHGEQVEQRLLGTISRLSRLLENFRNF